MAIQTQNLTYKAMSELTSGNSNAAVASDSSTTSSTTNTLEKNDDLNKSNSNCFNSNSSEKSNQEKLYLTRLPWGAVKEKPNFSNNLLASSDSVHFEKRKPGEYLMNLVVFNFVQIGSKKLEQIVNGDKRVIFSILKIVKNFKTQLELFFLKKDKRLRDCFQKNEDLQFDKLITTMSQVAEHSLPSLIRTLLIWHESQLANLSYLKQLNQQQNDVTPSSSSAPSKITLKVKQHLLHAKM